MSAGIVGYRPSRYHIEPNAKRSRASPKKPANIGTRETDLSTLSLVVRRPIQSRPAASARPRTGTIEGSDDAGHAGQPPHAAAGRLGGRLQDLLGGNRIGKLRRVDRADMGKRGKVAITDLIKADFGGFEASGKEARLGGSRAERRSPCPTA